MPAEALDYRQYGRSGEQRSKPNDTPAVVLDSPHLIKRLENRLRDELTRDALQARQYDAKCEAYAQHAAEPRREPVLVERFRLVDRRPGIRIILRPDCDTEDLAVMTIVRAVVLEVLNRILIFDVRQLIAETADFDASERARLLTTSSYYPPDRHEEHGRSPSHRDSSWKSLTFVARDMITGGGPRRSSAQEPRNETPVWRRNDYRPGDGGPFVGGAV